MTIDRELMRLIRIRAEQGTEVLAVADRRALLALVDDLEQQLAETTHRESGYYRKDVTP